MNYSVDSVMILIRNNWNGFLFNFMDAGDSREESFVAVKSAVIWAGFDSALSVFSRQCSKTPVSYYYGCSAVYWLAYAGV